MHLGSGVQSCAVAVETVVHCFGCSAAVDFDSEAHDVVCAAAAAAAAVVQAHPADADFAASVAAVAAAESTSHDPAFVQNLANANPSSRAEKEGSDVPCCLIQPQTCQARHRNQSST